MEKALFIIAFFVAYGKKNKLQSYFEDCICRKVSGGLVGSALKVFCCTSVEVFFVR